MAVLGVGLAACLSSLHEAQTAQSSIIVLVSSTGSGSSFDFGQVPVLTTASSANAGAFTVMANPADGSADTKLVSVTLDSGCAPTFSFPMTPAVPADLGCGSSAANGSTGGACTSSPFGFAVNFTPPLVGTYSCKMTLAWSTTTAAAGSGLGLTTNGTTIITLSGTGSAPLYSFSVTPSSWEFGSLPINSTSSAQTFVVKNDGLSTLSITPTVPAAPFQTLSGPVMPFGLGPGGTQAYSLDCLPTTTGTFGGSLSFTASPGLGSVIVHNVTLACTGVSVNVGTVPNPIPFGAKLVGGPATTQTATITLHSAGPETLHSFAVVPATGVDLTLISSPNPSVTLTATAPSTSATVQYNPSTPQPVGVLGTLTFTDGTNNFSVPITGGALSVSMGVSPTSVDFGPVCIGTTAQEALQVYELGTSSIAVNSATTTPATGFGVGTTSPLPFTLQGAYGNSLAFTATYTPPDGAFGSASDQIALSVTPGSIAPIALSATALPPMLAATPASLDYGNVTVGVTTGRSFTLSNCSSNVRTIVGTSMGGPNATEFTVLTPTDPRGTLKVLQTQDFEVAHTAITAGKRSAMLTVAFDDGSTVVVPLTSNAALANPNDRLTYYGCASSSPGGLAPVAGVLVAFGLRRRRRKG